MKISKATISIVAFLFFICVCTSSTLWASPSKKVKTGVANSEQVSSRGQLREGYQEIIQKAYNLCLQRDRQQASRILIEAIEKEANDSNAQKEMKSVLDDISQIFFLNKTQELYELAESLRRTNVALALERYKEALRNEEGNQRVLLAIIRSTMSKGDCKDSDLYYQKLKETNPYYLGIDLIRAQILVCLENLDALKIQLVKAKHDEKDQFWKMVDIEFLFKSGEIDKARAETLRLVDRAEKYPEPFYWAWKLALSTEETKKGLYANTYLGLCKNMTLRLETLYSKDPQVCMHKTELENYVKTLPAKDESK